MTLYVSTTHPDYRQLSAGAHRAPTRWDNVKDWVRSPYLYKGAR
jgi:hypothetical protein